jgi:branched-chain amino acid aminotransferase
MDYNLNGFIIRNKHLGITLDNRGLNYGDGLFETIKYSRKRLHFWEDHYFRLMASMRIVRMEIPLNFSPEYLEEQVMKTLTANKLENGAARVKILVVRKAGGYYTPQNDEPDFLITVSELKDSEYQLNEQGLEIDLFKDHYKLSGLLGNLKTSSAQLYTIAGVYARENNLDDVLILNEKKEVLESIKANLFLLRGNELISPPLESGCLKGIMRKQILETAPQLGLEVKEEAFSPFAIQKADELWLSNSIQGIQWVGKYRKKTFGKEKAQEMVKRLNVKVALSLD